jgi:hypothetical protein
MSFICTRLSPYEIDFYSKSSKNEFTTVHGDPTLSTKCLGGNTYSIVDEEFVSYVRIIAVYVNPSILCI